jgi:hypothetical protein
VAAWIKRHWGTLAGQAARAGILIFLVLDAYASYDLLIDHSVEYPWQPKTVLGINMPGGNLGATFGFPYNRQWRAIGAWFAAQPGQEQVLTTNEKLSIAGFYLPDTVHFKYIWRDAPKRLPEGDRIYFLVIRHPQSWVDQLWGRTFDQWHVRFEPAADFANDRGEVVASVYLISMDQYRSAVEN